MFGPFRKKRRAQGISSAFWIPANAARKFSADCLQYFRSLDPSVRWILFRRPGYDVEERYGPNISRSQRLHGVQGTRF